MRPNQKVDWAGLILCVAGLVSIALKLFGVSPL